MIRSDEVIREIRVRDLMGRMVLQTAVGRSDFFVNLEQFSAGSYSVEVIGEQLTGIRKLIVK